MIVLIVSAALVVLGLALALAFGRAGRMSVHAAEPVSTAGGFPLPPGEVTAAGLARVRFDTAARGYRMDQVDAVLDRLQARLADLEAGTTPHPGSPHLGVPQPDRAIDVRDLESCGATADLGTVDAPGSIVEGTPRRGAPVGGAGSVAAFPVVRRHDDGLDHDDVLRDDVLDHDRDHHDHDYLDEDPPPAR